MARLTDAQIAGAAKSGGFSGSAITKAVAIALAESGGNPNAHNAVPPDNSYGLWQINMLGSMGPARRKQYGISSNEALYDPVTNAKAAYAISNGGKSFGAWSTYISGAYLPYMSRAAKAAGNPSDAPGSSGGTADAQQAGLVSGVSQMGAFFDLLTNPITWMRVGMFLGGGLMLVIGLAMISGAADKAGQAAKMAVDFIPGAGAVKGLGKAAKAAKAV